MSIVELLQNDEFSARIVIGNNGAHIYFENGEWVVQVPIRGKRTSRYPYRGTDESEAVARLIKELADDCD